MSFISTMLIVLSIFRQNEIWLEKKIELEINENECMTLK